MKGTINQERLGTIMQAVMKELRALGGEARPKEILDVVRRTFPFTEYELGVLPSGPIRWETWVRFYSIDSEKAGYIVKRSGKWQLTQSGEKALELAPQEYFRTANNAYKTWRKGREPLLPPAPEPVDTELAQQPALEQAQETARGEIDKYLWDMPPFQFQDLVAELLNALGYIVSTVSKPGPDDGIDLIAYVDSLGFERPHIVVQVKHQREKAGLPAVRNLLGAVKESNVGLFVSLSGFARDVQGETRKYERHIELIDGTRLLELWIKHYSSISERGKQLLPLEPVYYLKPAD
jgi:restriction system protein